LNIHFTEQALLILANKQFPAGGGVLKLVYDNEGCGCAVNGVPALWILDEPMQGDLTALGEPYPVYYASEHEVYFENRLKIDGDDKATRLSLKSDQQIYTTLFRIIDKRTRQEETHV
jgi:uncharacterized protein YqkB